MDGPGFLGQRYWGEEELSPEKRKILEKKRLDDLLKSAKLREQNKEIKRKKESDQLLVNGDAFEEIPKKKKRKRSEEGTYDEVAPETVQTSESKCKTKSKNKATDVAEFSLTAVETDEVVHEKKPHKKKKKHVDEAIPETELIDDIQEKKSKKKKKDQVEEAIPETDLIVDEKQYKISKKKKKDHVNEVELETDFTINEKLGKKSKEKVTLADTMQVIEQEYEKERKKKKKKKSLSEDSVAVSDTKVEKKAQEITTRKTKPAREIGGFTIIGEVNLQNRGKVKRVLPEWLANPSVVSVDLKDKKVPVDQMEGLDPVFVKKLHENGISYFFPVQRQVIPWLLDSMSKDFFRPNDICVSAPTGSGKTLAYVLPIIQSLNSRVVPRIRVLVVLPVQELAKQVFGVFQAFCQGMNLKPAMIVAQQPFATEQKSLVRKTLTGFESLVDILVATPGRLVDHLYKTEGFSLKHLRFLVLDEADRVMEDSLIDWLKQVERHVYDTNDNEILPRRHSGIITADEMTKFTFPLQKLLFSATLSQNPEKLQQLNLFQPKLFTSVVVPKKEDYIPSNTNDFSGQLSAPKGDFIGKFTTPAELKECFVACRSGIKPLVLHYLATTNKWRRVLCFTNSADSTHRLSILLKHMGGLTVRELSSRIKPEQREKLLHMFADGRVDMLVCTDALARGIDIPNVDYVVSYDMPFYLKTYIHRIGRTARGGSQGTAIILLMKKEMTYFKRMIKEAGKTKVKPIPVARKKLEPLEDQYQEALVKLKKKLQEEELTMKAKMRKIHKFRKRKPVHKSENTRKWEINGIDEDKSLS